MNMRAFNSSLSMLALLLAFTGARAQAPRRNLPRISTVAFCELTSEPDKFVNKLARTEANYIVWWESSYLYGDRCNDSDHKIHNSWDCSDNDTACQKRFSAQWRKLDPYMRSKRSPIQTVYRVKAVLIGRLVGPGAYGHLSGFQYEFRIQRVGKVTAISRRVP